MSEYISGWERPVNTNEIREFNAASQQSRKIGDRIDGLFRAAVRIRDESLDHGRDIESEYAANISYYLYNVQLSCALTECREAVEWSNHFVTEFNNLANEIANLLTMPRYLPSAEHS